MKRTFSSWLQGRGESTPPKRRKSTMVLYIIVRLELPPATTCDGSTQSSSAKISRSSASPSRPP